MSESPRKAPDATLESDTAAPFVQAVDETFEKMLSCAVSLVPEREPMPRDVSAVVGLAGARRGAVVLSFGEAAACRVVSRLAGESHEELNATVCDGVAELLNIVAGRAKGSLSKTAGSIDMSLPTVVSGHDYEVRRHKEAPEIVLPFSSELGDFELRIFLEKEPGEPARVLVVDDSRVMRKLVRAALRDLAPSLEVVEADNLSRARESLAAHAFNFDLVLLDLHMPDGNGVTLLEELRKDARGASVPVIVVTSDPDVEKIVAAATARTGGAAITRCLEKPFLPTELVKAAQALVRRE